MSSPRQTIDLVVIQASPFCNIDCRYCYLPSRESRQLMEEQTLAKIYERIFESAFLGDRFQNLWHAGEPLTVPLAFYEKALAIQERFNRGRVQVEQVFQTNATLITQQWCEFFRTHEVRVGVSIDGPQPIHDAYRLTRSGRGTFEQAMRGVKLLQDQGIPVHVLAVLTSEALDRPDDIWEFLLASGVASVGFNLDVAKGIHSQSTVSHDGDVRRYQAFFRRLHALRSESGRQLPIRELDTMQSRIRFGSDQMGSKVITPLATLNFDCEGNISTYSPELLGDRKSKYGQLTFGSVFTSGIDEILTSEKFREVNADIERGVARCKATCQYFSVCGGGDPTNKLAENGTFDSTETMHCRLEIQALCDVVLENVEQDLGIASGS
jgi:uncharacterized protein